MQRDINIYNNNSSLPHNKTYRCEHVTVKTTITAICFFLSEPYTVCQYAGIYMSHIMRKPVFAICKQQRHRSACASARSLISAFVIYCLDSIISRFYMQNLKPLASLFSWVDGLES